MDQEHRATRESNSGLYSSAHEEQHCLCRGWFRRRNGLTMKDRKERAELNKKVLTALALYPPVRKEIDASLRVQYNWDCGRWETISRSREMAYSSLVALTVVTVLCGIGEVATYYGIAALYGFHRIW